jgi:4-amino-4-deoxy-L-arabinose transferase-like glycosyltransferase
MWLALRVLTLGIVPALWLSGYVLLAAFNRRTRIPVAGLTVWCLAPAISFPIWSLAMALSAYLGVFHAPTWGALGWIACLALAPQAWQWRRLGHGQAITKRLILGAVLAGSFALYAAFPHDSFFVGRDQGTYANQALHIARSGELFLDAPFTFDDASLREAIDGSYTATGLYPGAERLTVQFSPVFPIWLAIAFSALGIVGLQGFNALIATLSVGIFFGIAARLMSRRVALAATLLFAFNPMQIWISRVTLSEIIAQYLVLSGILLMFLAGRRRAAPLWLLAGLTLGASVLVRIDGFVLAPIAAAFVWLTRCLPRDARPQIARFQNLGVLSLLGILAVGVPFYCLTTAPYMSAQSKHLLPLGGCAAVLLVLGWARFGRRLLTQLVSQRGVWIGIGAAIALLGIYAYFIRPRWEPFSFYDNPHGVHARNFREDSFVNLGAYVTPLLPFVALLGFWSLLQRGLRPKTRGATLFLVLSCGGYSLLYLYSPSISPDHPWGMRRFVPMVIPGVVLLSSFILDRARHLRFLSRFHLPLTALTTLSLLAYTSYQARPALLLKEFDGAHELVTEIADGVPKGALLLCNVTSRVFGHLALARGLTTARFDLDSAEGVDAAQRLIKRVVEGDEPYYVLTDDKRALRGETPARVFSDTFSWLRETTAPPATTIRQERFAFHLYELRGPLPQPWKYLEGLGLSSIDGVREGGFWPTENEASQRTRWTNSEAWLDIPMKSGWRPRKLTLDIVDLSPAGTWLTVRANDAEIYNAKVDKSPILLDLALPEKIGKRLRLEMVSDTFRPSDRGGSDDHRDLGIRLKALTLR